jgi:hypothetical protein
LKIIFLIDANFSNREYERFGFFEMLNEKIEVQVFDFRKLRLGGWDSEEGFESDGDDDRVKRFNIINSKDLEDIVHEFIGAFIIDNRSGTYDKYTTFWFKSVGAYIVELDQGLVPASLWNPSIFDLIIMSKNTFINYGLISVLSQVIRYVLNRLKSNTSSKMNPNCCNIKVCSGAISKCSSGEFEIRSHAFDYDIYLQQKNQNSFKKQDNYAVFLDSGIVAHPDSRRLGGGMPSEIETVNTYYPAISSFFDDFEKKTGMRVVIALHPRIIISKELLRNYGDREVILKNTSSLVKNSKMVIVHNSTSMNFAVLWKIPLLIITTTIIDRINYSTMRSIEDIFKTKRININKPYKDKDYIKISRNTVAQYDSYNENLIKTINSPQVNSVKILIKGLKKYVQ